MTAMGLGSLRRSAVLWVAVGSLLLVTGCARDLAGGYPKYLENNAGESNLPRTQAASAYYLPAQTAQYSYTFRAFSTGLLNKWVVDVAEMLDATLQSTDVQTAFDGLRKASDSSATEGGLLTFQLQTYSFNDFAAQVAMHVSLEAGGETVLSKVYNASGKSQRGKMMMAGAFGQKNAVQQSTKSALDQILRHLIDDIDAREN